MARAADGVFVTWAERDPVRRIHVALLSITGRKEEQSVESLQVFIVLRLPSSNQNKDIKHDRDRMTGNPEVIHKS